MSEARLAELAARYGIEPAYHDVWGNRHTASDAVLRSLLQAMHVDAATADEIESSIARHEQENNSRVLPSTLVVKASALADGVRIQLARADGDRTLIWRIEEEAGRVHDGGFQPCQLRELTTFDLDGQPRRACMLPLPATLPPGYHRLAVLDDSDILAEARLIVAPDQCYQPAAFANGARVWGGAVQLYALRSERNWGIGDYTDLRNVLAQWGACGAAMVGVNPLHALFWHDAAHASPYSPSSRLFFNVLYIDVEAMVDFGESAAARTAAGAPAFIAELQRLRDSELVDYAAVAAAKRPLFEILYAHFRSQHLAADTARAREFRAFCTQRGGALERFALFEALQEHISLENPGAWGWQQWPEQYRNPAAPAVACFAREHGARVEFFQYLQWQAEVQIAAVEQQCFELGLAIGLYADLAVSIDPAGAEAWANQDLYAQGARIGAPPDVFNPAGQDWGLPPLVPARLNADGYSTFIATLRANMAHAGALRIDHVMGLARLFWVPPGMRATDGAYVRYAFADALGILALESHRQRCLVIGEDLGTVPDDVRAALERAGVLSYRLFMFEHDEAGQFKPPSSYPRQALAAFSTHDLPTLHGYWRGHDVLARESLNLIPEKSQRDVQMLARARERAGLLLALEREGLLEPEASLNFAAVDALPALGAAVHRYLARTPSMLALVQIEDVIGMLEQANQPGTVNECPNWRRKLPLTLEQFAGDARFTTLAAMLKGERGSVEIARPRAVPRAVEVSIPRATYRLQFHRGFTFRDATQLVPYLAELGISHVYCSPYLRARAGSTHGYDIVDHNVLNPEIGSSGDYDAFVAALSGRGMRQLIDVVPNHMGVMGADNAWWLDVLENGRASLYADFFDIDWQPASPDLAGRVLLPVLGDHYGTVLEKRELELRFDGEAGAFSVHYHAHKFPIDPRAYPRVLERADAGLDTRDIPEELRAEFKSLVSAFGDLPARDETAAARVALRRSNQAVHKRNLARLAAGSDAIASALANAVRGLNGASGGDGAQGVDALHELLEAQAYRLALWRVASDEINYRRFFDVNELAALRIENDAVFEATHRKIFELLRAGTVDALRIDHPDGLFDPAAYCRRLQERYRQLRGLPAPAAEDGQQRPLYVVTEKIIAPFEDMPETWGIYGTTGYRYANVLNGLFVDGAAESRLTRLYHAFIGDDTPFEQIAARSKHLIMRIALASELMVLANRLARIARSDRATRDYTLTSLRDALAEVVARFPVYRTYMAAEIADADRRYIEWAVARAKRHSHAGDASIFDFIGAVLLCDPARPTPAAAAMRMFAGKFQQFTSPVMAKGVEDTAFYIYNRLVSLNDVGGDPAAFGVSVSAFHGASADRAAKWPFTMLATSTHDNKRSEDTRARIDVLSELPAVWRLQLRRWARINRSKKRKVDGDPAPSRNDEYLLYQTLLGTFPAAACSADDLAAYAARVERYMLKAGREAKVRTSWMNPDREYEAAVAHFVRALLVGAERNLFLEEFRPAAAAVAWFGMLNSLSMMLIKYTSPGVPDCYQGNELWDYSLVDPDNRRAVDYDTRRAALASLQAMMQQDAAPAARMRALLAAMNDGLPKLYSIWRLLALRRARSGLFRQAGYTPLQATGSRSAQVVAYARRHAGSGVVTIAGRMFAKSGLAAGMLPCGTQYWSDTEVELPFLKNGAVLRHVLTGESMTIAASRLRVGDAFALFPGAVLEYDDGEATNGV